MEVKCVRQILLCAGCSSVAKAFAKSERGWTVRQWTNQCGKTHGRQALWMSPMGLVLSNILFAETSPHKAVIYSGEHPAAVNTGTLAGSEYQHNLSRVETRSQRKVGTASAACSGTDTVGLS